MSLDWRVVPIQRWPTEPTKERKQHRFSTTRRRYSEHTPGHSWVQHDRGVDWGKTTALLERELEYLGARNILLQMQVTARDIRNDGWIRADARPSGPGVILTFDSDYGPLSYPCDTYGDWKANVRAIALSLEALRAVDRHGVTRRGEQYTGFGQLPPAGGTTSTMTAQTAAIVIANHHPSLSSSDVLEGVEAYRNAYRQAAAATHPDRAGGSTEAFQLVQQARAILDRHHGIKS